ncbi:MAG: peptidoglycan bridge formation glycyltransferase FemA/FemB family protein [Betaproteobacteria bacterium]|nr:peptidoglycan bridge formation glycyltransferase FemA/FemB family protein [Betaproteobacteria bacterium]
MIPSNLTPAAPEALRSDSDQWQEWDRFVEASADPGLMQTSWWAEFRAWAGYRCFGITIKDRGAILGGAMVMKRCFGPHACFYCICDGPVLPADEEAAGEVFQAILDVVERHRIEEYHIVSHLRIEPRWGRVPEFVSGFQLLARGDRYSEPRDTLCIDLRPSMDEILAQMKPKGRYNVRLAQRHGVAVCEDTSEGGLADFVRIHGDTAARRRIDPKSPAYFEKLLSMLSPRQRISIFFAEHQGRRLATALVVYFGRRATYFFGGSLDVDRHVMAPYALHYEIMRRVRERGCECYDLWGVAPPSRADDPWQGISAFKRKFGGHELSLVPTLDRIYDAAAYRAYGLAAAAWSLRNIAGRPGSRVHETVEA